MLAGSITNAKLSNSTVTVGSTSIALGAASTSVDGLTAVTVLGTAGTTINHANSIGGLTATAPFVQKTSGGVPSLSIEASGRITTASGIRALGNSFILGPKESTVNFIANEGAETQINDASGVVSGEAFVTVDSTVGMKAGDKVIFSVYDSDSSDTASGRGSADAGDQSLEYTIGSVDSATQFTVSHYDGSSVSNVWHQGDVGPYLPPPDWVADNSWVDVLGTNNLTFRNANVNQSGTSDLQFDYAAPSLGKDGGYLRFRTYNRRPTAAIISAGDTAVERLTVDSVGKLEFNPEQKSTADFKVSGLGSANLLVADASEDRVGVNTGSPKATLHVNGSSAFHVAGKKSSNFTTGATQNIVTLRVNDDTETTATAPAVFEKGRVIRYVMHTVESGNTGWFTVAPNSLQSIEKNDEFGATNDGTRGDQLKYVGEMITLIGSNTDNVWIAVKSGANPRHTLSTQGVFDSYTTAHTHTVT